MLCPSDFDWRQRLLRSGVIDDPAAALGSGVPKGCEDDLARARFDTRCRETGQAIPDIPFAQVVWIHRSPYSSVIDALSPGEAQCLW